MGRTGSASTQSSVYALSGLHPVSGDNLTHFGEALALSGAATPGAQVTLQLGGSHTRQVTADAAGHWSLAGTATPATTRYVWLYQETPNDPYNAWSVGEVVVMSGGVNVAAGKPASLSWSSTTTTALTDGNPNSYAEVSGNGRWMQIDLGAAYAVESVQVSPRLDWPWRLVGTQVVLSNTSAAQQTAQAMLGMAESGLLPRITQATTTTWQVLPLDSGSHTVTATATNAQGVSESSSQVVIVGSRTALRIELDSIGADQQLNSREVSGLVTLTGSSANGKTGDSVTLTVNQVRYSGTLDAVGRFAIAVKGSDLAADADKRVEATLHSSTAAGQAVTTTTASGVYSVDTSGPLASVAVNAIALDNIVNAREATSMVAVTGSSTGARLGDRISVLVNGQTYHDTVGANGQFSVMVKGSDLAVDADKRIEARLIASDAAGNTSTAQASHAYTVNTSAPVTTLTLDPVSGDKQLSVAEATGSVVITGSASNAQPGDTVTLTVNKVLYNGSVEAGGRFAIQVSGFDLVADADKRIDAHVVASNAAGNTSSASAQSEAYSVPALPSTTSSQAVKYGQPVVLSGDAQALSQVSITLPNGSVRQVQADAAGHWSTTVTAAPEAARYVWLYQARPRDAYNAWSVGDVSVMSGGVNVAAGKPATRSWNATAVTDLTDGNNRTYVEASGKGRWVQIDLGSAMPVDAITVVARNRWDSRVEGTQVVLSNTDAATLPPLAMLQLAGAYVSAPLVYADTQTLSMVPMAAGQVSFNITSTLANGNLAHTTQVITLDGTPPSKPILTLVEDTGEDSTDFITANGTLHVGFENGQRQAWSVSLDGGKTWQQGSGDSFVVPEGKYSAQKIWVKCTDAAGNTAMSTLPEALEVQNRAARAWLETDLSASVPQGAATSDTRPTLRGELGLPLGSDERIAVYLNGAYKGQATALDKEWAFDFDTLSVQTHQITWRLEAQTPTGWVARSADQTQTVEVVPPGTPLYFNRADVERGLTFSGQAEPFTKIRVTLGEKVNAVVTADSSGRWSSSFYKQASLYGDSIPSDPKPWVKIEQMNATGTAVSKPLYEHQVHIDQTIPLLNGWTAHSQGLGDALLPGQQVSLTLNFSKDPGSSFTLNSLRCFGGQLSNLSGSGAQRTVTFTAEAVPIATQAYVELLKGELQDPAGNLSPSGQRWTWDMAVGTQSPLQPTSQHFEVRAGKAVSLDLRDPGVNLDGGDWQVRISGVPAGASLNHGVANNGTWTVAGRDLADLRLLTADSLQGRVELTTTYERKDALGRWQAVSQARIHGEIEAWLGIEDVKEVEDFSNLGQLEEAWNLGLTGLSGKGIKVGINEGTSVNLNDTAAFDMGRVVAGSHFGDSSGAHGHNTGLRMAGSLTGSFTGPAYDSTIKWSNGDVSGLDVSNWSVAAYGNLNPMWNLAVSTTGRGGLGTVWVISAGNNNGMDNTAMSVDTKNPIAIAAASLDNLSGGHAGFSTSGPAVWVAHAGWGGTSYASPGLAGQVALLLQANPDLGVRDVKNILANAATYLPTATPTKGFGMNGGDTFNGAGFHYSNDVGFGSSNVYNAARLAKDWLRQGEASTLQRNWETQSPVALTSGTSISAKGQTATTVTISVTDDMRLEALQLHQFMDSTHFDKMRVWITSPAGTTSELTEGNTLIKQAHESFDLTSHKFFGESSKGTWTVRYEHTQDVGAPATLSNVSLKFFGDAAPTLDRYVYTDQFNTHFAAADAATQKKMLWLSDSDGGTDAVMGSAMNTKIEVDLGRGGHVTLLNRSIGILGGAVIENAFGGDGDDLLVGNQVRGSVLGGNAGDDTLISRGQASRLEGGEGLDTIWLQRGDVALGGEGADRFFFYERQLSFTTANELQRAVLDFDAAQDSVFKVDAQGALQIARFGANGELLRWDAVVDTSVLAEFAAMRTAAQGPVLMDMTVSGSTVGMVFDQALAVESMDSGGFSVGSQQAHSVSITDHVLNLGFGQMIGSGVVHLNFATDPIHSGLGVGFEANHAWLGTSASEVIDASAHGDGNVVFSHGGNDTLMGGAGADMLWVQDADGGNTLRGGAGADTFAWNAPTGSSKPFAQGQDVVLDFKLGEDRLMLTDLFADVVETQSLDQWLQLSREGNSAVLRVDDDGDGQFDAGFSIKLQDFYLQNTTVSTLTLDELRRQGGLEV
ncbi:MAG: Ig-like domain-containing protein [Ideonella sp.]|nr:Ig-like domain-containing protein [Ideonella sp.]